MPRRLDNPFLRRLQQRRVQQCSIKQEDALTSPPEKPSFLRFLAACSYVAQVAVVAVAIFGYFYTVQPVYQKERLAEQVAEYEGIIKKQGPKVAELEQQLIALRHEREQLAGNIKRERESLSKELRIVEKKLSAARADKAKIEDEIQFMTYQYRLPDGRPARTAEEVEVAKEANLRHNYFLELSLACAYRYGNKETFPSNYVTRDAKSKYFPFSEQEMAVWKDINAKYPLKRVRDCVDSLTRDYVKKHGQSFPLRLIESFGTEALQQVNAAATRSWTPPMEPTSVIQELATKRTAIEQTRLSSLKKVEEEYGDWESVLLPDRRAIYKYNYEVGKRNAETTARSDLFNAEWAAREKWDKLRKSIGDEMQRLLAFTKSIK